MRTVVRDLASRCLLLHHPFRPVADLYQHEGLSIKRCRDIIASQVDRACRSVRSLLQGQLKEIEHGG